MFETVLRTKYVSLKNCFVYLSPSHKQLNTGSCIKISHAEKEAYFSASVMRNTVDIESIGINRNYAKLLGIGENEFVSVMQVKQLPVVNSISIRPFTKADYEILEILSQNVQSNLLDQVRVVNTGQKLLIWIGNGISVPVTVENVQPIAPGLLDFLTEVVIKPPASMPIITKNMQVKSEKLLTDFIKILQLNSSDNIQKISADKFEINTVFHYRLASISQLPHTLIEGKLLHSFCAFIIRGQTTISNDEFYSIQLSNSLHDEKTFYLKLIFIDDLQFQKNVSRNIFVSDSVLNFLHTEFGARVKLRKVEKFPAVNEIEVHSRKNYSVNIVEQLKVYLANHSNPPLIWNANFPLEIDKGLYCFLKFLPNSDEYCVINEDFLRNCTYSVCDELVKPLDNEEIKKEVVENFCMEISTLKQCSDDVFSILFQESIYRPENIIITGKTGTGKSSLLHYISERLRSYPYLVNSEVMQCKKLKGKTVDSLHKLFSDLFGKLVFSQPSMIILDDLDILCEQCEGEESPNSIYFNRVSEMLYGLFASLVEHNQISILATTDSISKLNKHIYRSRGNHLFKNVFDIGDLNKTDRATLLKFFFHQHATETNLNYDDISIKIDGFVIQDVRDFYEKTLFEAYKDLRKNDGEPTIRKEHCDSALTKSCALSLQNVKFHAAGSKTFDDIGGLHNVKNILVESLLWPIKYSNIFARAPLRLQSGILLYGPPGTGKTMLAGAAAKQCSLRLISVKGPELLSKYIGASEQAVRDVFDKAQRAKPCILFFDEFDSLAPRRGHDNTGVTDRVVNQLLTQLDGVEALTGICVLAATSRPDLLDPALLRPGRLDKQLLCDMPNQAERLEILQILSNKLCLTADINFDEIAAQTEGYSGADLQSVLYTAQIASLKEFDKASQTETNVSQDILLEALSKTRPSLTKSERARYGRIYAKFQGGNIDDFKTGSKVTLA